MRRVDYSQLEVSCHGLHTKIISAGKTFQEMIVVVSFQEGAFRISTLKVWYSRRNAKVSGSSVTVLVLSGKT